MHCIRARFAVHHVVADSAVDYVTACATVNIITRTVGVDDVGKCIARAGEHLGTRQRQVLQEGSQAVGKAAQERVRAAVVDFSDRITEAIDHVGVIAGPANHGIIATTTIQEIIAGFAS